MPLGERSFVDDNVSALIDAGTVWLGFVAGYLLVAIINEGAGPIWVNAAIVFPTVIGFFLLRAAGLARWLRVVAIIGLFTLLVAALAWGRGRLIAIDELLGLFQQRILLAVVAFFASLWIRWLGLLWGFVAVAATSWVMSGGLSSVSLFIGPYLSGQNVLLAGLFVYLTLGALYGAYFVVVLFRTLYFGRSGAILQPAHTVLRTLGRNMSTSDWISSLLLIVPTAVTAWPAFLARNILTRTDRQVVAMRPMQAMMQMHAAGAFFLDAAFGVSLVLAGYAVSLNGDQFALSALILVCIGVVPVLGTLLRLMFAGPDQIRAFRQSWAIPHLLYLLFYCAAVGASAITLSVLLAQFYGVSTGPWDEVRALALTLLSDASTILIGAVENIIRYGAIAPFNPFWAVAPPVWIRFAVAALLVASGLRFVLSFAMFKRDAADWQAMAMAALASGDSKRAARFAERVQPGSFAWSLLMVGVRFLERDPGSCFDIARAALRKEGFEASDSSAAILVISPATQFARVEARELAALVNEYLERRVSDASTAALIMQFISQTLSYGGWSTPAGGRAYARWQVFLEGVHHSRLETRSPLVWALCEYFRIDNHVDLPEGQWREQIRRNRARAYSTVTGHQAIGSEDLVLVMYVMTIFFGDEEILNFSRAQLSDRIIGLLSMFDAHDLESLEPAALMQMLIMLSNVRLGLRARGFDAPEQFDTVIDAINSKLRNNPASGIMERVSAALPGLANMSI